MAIPGRRKVLLINPQFQLSFMAYFMALSAATVAVFYGATFYFFHNLTRLGLDIGLPANHVFFEFVRTQQTTMNWVFLVTSLLVFGALFVGGLFLSNRVAGSLYRLHKHMADVAEGKPMGDVKFRKNDYFPELADDFNRCMKKVAGPGQEKTDATKNAA